MFSAPSNQRFKSVLYYVIYFIKLIAREWTHKKFGLSLGNHGFLRDKKIAN